MPDINLIKVDKNWNIPLLPSQQGRIAIVTGANSGIGFETALSLAGKGAKVIIASRNNNKAVEAAARIRKKYGDSSVDCMHLDLSRLSSVRNFSETFLGNFGKLDLLINNAGMMMPPHSLTEDGFESQLGINYLGHFLLTGLLLPAMKNQPGARVVTVSSLAHKYGNIRIDDLQFTKGYNKLKAYSQSKLACLMFAYELQRRLTHNNSRVISLAAHPGVASTSLGRNMSPVLRYFFPRIGQPAAEGALPLLMAALSDNVKGGDYCGPDGWNEMRGRPVIVQSSKLSKDPDLAKQLWTLSEQLVGHTYQF
jgi:NAD(P)-dependent dehydrogenase (short-subunit alcohol dehydrogenase family)